MRFALICSVALAACGDSSTVRVAPHGDLDSGTTPVAGSSTSGTGSTTDTGPCPGHMVRIDSADGEFCIDQYEARLSGWSPYEVPTTGEVAEVLSGVIPQGYISGDVAADACALAGKRLCSSPEWLRACQGPDEWTFPYGDSEIPDACNTTRAAHPVVELFGAKIDWSPGQMNDPRINQLPDSVDAGGSNPQCVTPEGVYDMHGNLHEWVSDADGVFRGGFYTDAVINGPGCLYRTSAHTTPYHDYSTGFRCCADPS